MAQDSALNQPDLLQVTTSDIDPQVVEPPAVEELLPAAGLPAAAIDPITGCAAVAAPVPPPAPAEPARPDADQGKDKGVGVEGEELVWSGRYSLKNFAGRFVLRLVLTAGWIALAVWTWGLGGEDPNAGNWSVLTALLGAALLLYWLVLGWRVLQARLGHHYELTNRRLFIATGCFHRRRDQVELLKIKDVYLRQQGLSYRLMNVGTVVVESSEEKLPIHYLTGVDDPHAVMDLIWHQARKEQDLRSVRVDNV